MLRGIVRITIDHCMDERTINSISGNLSLRDILGKETVTLSALGISMSPLIKGGEDKVVIEPLSGLPHKNDVVLFQKGDKLVLHRVVAFAGCYVVTQGDNNNFREHVDPSCILGKLQRVIKKSGSLWSCSDTKWKILSVYAILRRNVLFFFNKYFDAAHRCLIAPWYFVCLILLMWAPINGLGVALDNYLFGIRLDHCLHASIYLPCSWFLSTNEKRHPFVIYLVCLMVAITTEFGQMLLPYRGFDINDLVANFLGVSLGWAIFRCYIRKHS